METNFNFKSQVCTDKNQSERLLALGLKKETADMHLQSTLNDVWSPYIPTAIPYSRVEAYNLSKDVFRIIPAWSFDRIREMLNKSGMTISFVERDTSIIVERYCVFQNVHDMWDNIYENICDSIEWLIKEGYFNKEYLEE